MNDGSRIGPEARVSGQADGILRAGRQAIGAAGAGRHEKGLDLRPRRAHESSWYEIEAGLQSLGEESSQPLPATGE